MSEVILAGAGCGSVRQCTLEVLEAIRQADIIFYDDLMDPALLEENPSARKVRTGKRAGKHSVPQEEIQQLLIEAAGQYEHVLRLKGGDPFVFGRGYEEQQALEQAGIACRILPGLSSCIAIPERCGIPVTARDVAASFLVTTAHHKDGSLFDLDPSFLAAYPGTLVILMGVGRLAEIRECLLQAGMDPETPAALCISKDIVHSRALRMSLKDLQLPEENPTGPGVLVIGQAAGLPDTDIPETGICGTDAFIEDVRRAAAGNVRLKPLLKLEIVPACENLNPDLLQADWLVFTSRHGARLFLDWLKQEKRDLRRLGRIACIGTRTAAVFEEAGIFPELTGSGTSEELAERLIPRLQENDQVVCLRSSEADGKMEERLADHARIRRVSLYSLRPHFQETGDCSRILFGSALAVRLWKQEHPESRAQALCIGPVCAGAAVKAGYSAVVQAEEISVHSLVKLLEEE